MIAFIFCCGWDLCLVKGKKGILIKIPMHEIDILIKVLFQSTFNGKGMKNEMQFENEMWIDIIAAKIRV